MGNPRPYHKNHQTKMEYSRLRRFGKRCLQVLGSLLLCGLVFLVIPYTGTTIFDFPAARPFSGDHIYNPYEEISTEVLKANFHAHSKCWAGITNGRDSENEVMEAYLKHGYDVASISNYHKIGRYSGGRSINEIPVYEHGYGITKSHYLAINAHSVSFFEFPLWQNSSHQHKIINRLSEKADLIAIAHPGLWEGRSIQNMEELTGYHLTEVLSHYKNSEAYWDKALSAGRLSWILGNDDIHSIEDERIFQIWNNVLCPSADQMVENLKLGKSYITQAMDRKSNNVLLSCKLIEGNGFRLALQEKANIQFIGQNGVEKQLVVDADSATYYFKPDDAYIRVVARNDASSIYLNPLIRYQGGSVFEENLLVASPLIGRTYLWRGVFVFFVGITFYFWVRLLRW